MPEKKHQTAKYKTFIHIHVNITKMIDHLKFYWSIHKDGNPLIYVNKVVALFLLTEKMLSRKYRAKNL